MSAQEYTGGFFNHFDDPDEFWDDEPLVVNSPPARPGTPPPAPIPREPEYSRAPTAPGSPPRSSSLVEVKCGLDRLPVSVVLKPAWKEMFPPAQYSRSIMDAYHDGVQEFTLGLVASGTIPPSTIPTLRDAAPLLLRTRTLSEYTDLYNELFTQPVHTVHGPGYSRYGEPGITVVAKRTQLISIAIAADWAVGVDARYIAQDIVDCCAQIRARKPRLVRDRLLDQESDSEVAGRIVQHQRTLAEREN